MSVIKKILLAVCAALCLTSFTACAGRMPEASKDIFAMDTYMNIRACGDNADDAVSACCAGLEKLDALMDAEDEESEVYRLNEQKDALLSEDTFEAICRARQISLMTDGAFDITVRPVIKAWGFTADEHRVPDAKELEELLKYVGQEKIQINMMSFSDDGSTESVRDLLSATGPSDKNDMFQEIPDEDRRVEMPENCEIDLGGIAKGLASDRIMRIFEEKGVTGGLAALGGNITAYGTKPDGSLWRVAIQNPDPNLSSLKKADYIGVVNVSGKHVITSGGYERFFEENGVRYHHIIDPHTGYPADSGLISVSIVSGEGWLADGLSTALFVMGKDKALEFWSTHKERFDCILVDDAGRITVTEGLEDTFTSELDYEVYS